jgi:methanogenic corrinoid protein MtbC1
MKGMGVIGRQFRDNEVFIPEVIMASLVMKIGLNMIKPFLIDNCLSNKGKIVIGTIFGDLHDLGKNVVGIMLEGAGFSIIDLGVDVPKERFIEAVGREHPDILALSCTLTNTLSEIEEVVNALKKTSYGKQVKVLVGGLAVTQDFAQSIGADAYGEDSKLAVVKALAMID